MSNSYLKDIDSLSLLSEENFLEAKDFANKIDITNSSIILHYGESYQKRIAKASETISKMLISKVKYPIKDYFNKVLTVTSEFSSRCSRNIRLDSLILRFLEVRTLIQQICNELESYQLNLMHEKDELETWKSRLNDYYIRITQYIISGNLSINQIKQSILPELEKRSPSSVIDAEQYNKMLQYIEYFESKLFQLNISQQQVVQLILQVNLQFEDDKEFIRRIREFTKITIPKWEGTIIIALGIKYSNKSTDVETTTIESFNRIIFNSKDDISKAAKQMEEDSLGIDLKKIQNANETLCSVISDALSN